MKKLVAFSVFLLLFYPVQGMAKTYKLKKWGDSHVDSRLRSDGKKDILIGPKDGKVSYMRTIPSQNTGSLMRQGDQGIVIRDDKGESHIMRIIRK